MSQGKHIIAKMGYFVQLSYISAQQIKMSLTIKPSVPMENRTPELFITNKYALGVQLLVIPRYFLILRRCNYQENPHFMCNESNFRVINLERTL
uniref:Uncharacterized protein n=1 Tax=Arundo donax TaxID=35708 RepID=A0A0A9CY10_ARUDO